MPGSATREKALQAALELFGRKGYDRVSMNDIAEAVGIRAPSLYKHFAGKEALFAATAPYVRERYQTLWQDAANAQAVLEREVRGPGARDRPFAFRRAPLDRGGEQPGQSSGYRLHHRGNNGAERELKHREAVQGRQDQDQQQGGHAVGDHQRRGEKAPVIEAPALHGKICRLRQPAQEGIDQPK